MNLNLKKLAIAVAALAATPSASQAGILGWLFGGHGCCGTTAYRPAFYRASYTSYYGGGCSPCGVTSYYTPTVAYRPVTSCYSPCATSCYSPCTTSCYSGCGTTAYYGSACCATGCGACATTVSYAGAYSPSSNCCTPATTTVVPSTQGSTTTAPNTAPSVPRTFQDNATPQESLRATPQDDGEGSQSRSGYSDGAYTVQPDDRSASRSWSFHRAVARGEQIKPTLLPASHVTEADEPVSDGGWRASRRDR